MKFKNEFLRRYLIEAPVSLSLERVLECELYSKKAFRRPILDVGCGEGLFAHILFDEKIDVGIDPNEGELQKAREYGSYEKLIRCFGDKMPGTDSSFNTIFSNSVVEHIENLSPVLKEMHRLLSSDGELYITCPTNYFEEYSLIFKILILFRLRSFAERFARFYNKFWRHYHAYSIDKWSELFRNNGFEVINIDRYDGKWSCLMNDILAYFALPAFVIKKALNRWILSKRVRGIYVGALAFVFGSLLRSAEKTCTNSGLVFFSLRKS